jgi:hypothetical protein
MYAHTPCFLVLVSLGSLDAPRPVRLSQAVIDRRERVTHPIVRDVCVDRLIQSAIRKIGRGETLVRD